MRVRQTKRASTLDNQSKSDYNLAFDPFDCRKPQTGNSSMIYVVQYCLYSVEQVYCGSLLYYIYKRCLTLFLRTKGIVCHEQILSTLDKLLNKNGTKTINLVRYLFKKILLYTGYFKTLVGHFVFFILSKLIIKLLLQLNCCYPPSYQLVCITRKLTIAYDRNKVLYGNLARENVCGVYD